MPAEVTTRPRPLHLTAGLNAAVHDEGLPEGRNASRVRAARQYADLKRQIKQAGLLDLQPGYYTYKILFTLGLLCVSLGFLLVLHHAWVQLLNAVFLAFVFGQLGFLGHDIGHRQVFRTTRLFHLGSSIVANLLLGSSWRWWIDKHNRHHGQPNRPDVDPDIGMPMLAFSEEQAQSKRGLLRLMVKYQGYLFLPWELLGWVAFLLLSMRFLFQRRTREAGVEAGLMALHYVAYFGVLFLCLAPLQAILFFIIHRALFGLYVGSVAAPNHKGMGVAGKDGPVGFLRQQVLSSRNVRGHVLVDFWYGGLNYQIEHHLFPALPRNRLKEAQVIVKSFCRRCGIAYHETTVLQSYREIFLHLHQVSAPLRRNASAGE